MPTWNSQQYLQFANERTQPASDLAARIAVRSPRRVIDLGCGPGNSTAVLMQRWPDAEITGLDSSSSMLSHARHAHPHHHWVQADMSSWAYSSVETAPNGYDVIFSNAALQWVPNHDTMVPRIFAKVNAGGAFAFQVPNTLASSHQMRMRELAESAKWHPRFTRPPATWLIETPEFYYDALAPLAAKIDLWLTDYAHVLAGPEGVVEWYRGTGLRPYLDALPDDVARTEFVSDYGTVIASDFPRRSDGRILMYFRRLFVIAYRAAT